MPTSRENQGTTIELVTRLAHELFIPFTKGVGISRIDDMNDLVKIGANKLSVNSSKTIKPSLITEGSQLLG